MGERLRGIEVRISVDTNKRATFATVRLHEDETIEQFIERVKERIEEVAHVEE